MMYRRANILDYGGKANSLIKLQNLGLPVPPFFVIPASLLKDVINQNNYFEEIQQLLLEKNYQRIRKIIMSVDFPEQIKNSILKEANKLGGESFSVRSSADNEDGKKKSFAGQYETYLNVGTDELLKTIKKCWLSALSENVIAYENKQINLFSINIIVQKMINPEYSGVSFSIDPTSRSRNYSVIEMCRGTGEKLVSGQVTPTKMLVQRKNLEIDFKIGSLSIPDDAVRKLEKYVLKIEKAYNVPIDMEWCYLDGVIYVLQARPITAHQDNIIPFVKNISREKTLLEIEIYYLGEYFGIKELTSGDYYFNPLFVVDRNSFASIFYDCFSLEEYPPNIFRELDKNFDLLQKRYDEAKNSCKYLTEIINNNSEINVKKFIKELIKIQPLSSLGNLIGKDWDSSKRVKELLIDYRNKYDKIIYESTDYLVNNLEKNIPNDLKNYLPVLSIHEICNQQKINLENVKKRLNGYIYYNGSLFLEELGSFCQENGFMIKTEEHGNKIRGAIAYGGKTKGRVKVILSRSDFKKFNDGDILVTAMTTPKFTELMKRASGIITDEGGITCHAAIVARELKKPCLVGCKNATAVLKDNDEIELDAINGAVGLV